MPENRDKIRVLIADSSGFARLVMTDILSADPDIEVVGTAMDGDEMISKARLHSPDVIVLDVEIPKSARLSVIRRMAEEKSVRFVLSGREEKLREDALRAISQCAYDIIIKPEGVVQSPLRSIAEELIQKVKRIAHTDAEILGTMAEEEEEEAELSSVQKLRKKAKDNFREPTCLVVIGSSTGGNAAVEFILSRLPADFPGAILVAQHMPYSFTSTFVRRLSSLSHLVIEETTPGVRIEAGKVIIAPGETNIAVSTTMGLKNMLQVNFSTAEAEDGSPYDKPSVDMLMQTAAQVYNERVLGIILSGMGRDGTLGATAIAQRGGKVWVQDQATSVVYGMAKAALDAGCVERVLSLTDIPKYLDYYVRHFS